MVSEYHGESKSQQMAVPIVATYIRVTIGLIVVSDQTPLGNRKERRVVTVKRMLSA
jgi:hypothetical protein